VTYDSDLEKARKLIKQIGLELQQDPEFGPNIIEPLKMQGVNELGDYAVMIRAKVMTVPGEQFVIRRKAYAMIKKAFDEIGIKFAFPTCDSRRPNLPIQDLLCARRVFQFSHVGATSTTPGLVFREDGTNTTQIRLACLIPQSPAGCVSRNYLITRLQSGQVRLRGRQVSGSPTLCGHSFQVTRR
jgi:hypothetical protein